MPRIRTAVLRTDEAGIEWRAALLVVQMYEFLQQPEKNFLFVPGQLPHQPALKKIRRRDELLQKRNSFGSKVEQAKAPALHRHHSLQESASFQPDCQIRGSRSIECAKPGKGDLVNPGMVLEDPQNTILDWCHRATHRRVKNRDSYLLRASDQMARLVIDIDEYFVIAPGSAVQWCHTAIHSSQWRSKDMTASLR
jgi:hypothetical protein